VKVEKYRAVARRWWRQEIRQLLIVALVLFSIRSSLADWNDVPNGSMKPTILEGDRVFVNKLAYDLKVPFTTRHISIDKKNYWLPRWSRTCSSLESKAE
jgi:signal peptidase I